MPLTLNAATVSNTPMKQGRHSNPIHRQTVLHSARRGDIVRRRLPALPIACDHGALPSKAPKVGSECAARKAEPLQANDTFNGFLRWTIWTLAATGAALLLMAALI
jgi:hypothetical protein